MIRRTFKYRLYPAKAQVMFLEGQLREARDLYNCALEERRSAWKTCRKFITYYDQVLQLKPIRAEGLTGLVNSQVARDVLSRVDKAYKAFFRRVKAGQKPGYPRFRSFRRFDSITFQTYGAGCRLMPNGRLRIQGAGLIKVKLHRQIEGKIKTVTLQRSIGKWYVCFSVECGEKPLPDCSESVGIDVGLTTFAVLSDGTEIENPRFYREGQAKLRRAQRKVARRKKGSNRRRKAVLALRRVHAHLANQRADFLHKESRRIVNSFGLIAVEDLNVKGLSGGMLAKSVHDAAWGMFYRFIAYKAESAGRVVVAVNPSGTSQTCLCGAKVPKRLQDRWHQCPSCGLSGTRDAISSQVILQRARTEPSWANVGGLPPCVPREAVNAS
jgi:putative transposase